MVASQAALGFHSTNMAVTPGKARGSQVSDNGFLPMTRAEMTAKGWSELDVLIITGDAYVDHPSSARP
jgi:hypothetical protein